MPTSIHTKDMPVPVFQQYYPSFEMMSGKQKAFYRYLEQGIEVKQYPPVCGQISYLFVYAYNILTEWKNRGYQYIHNRLLDLAEAYYLESKFASACRYWAYDCLLNQEMYEEYLVLTEPQDYFTTNTNTSNTRCNIRYLLKQPADAIDILRMSGVRVTAFTKKHPAAFRDFLEAVFQDEEKMHGPWLERMLSAMNPAKPCQLILFSGAPINQPQVTFPYYCFYGAYDFVTVIHDAVRAAENRLRDANNVPRIGEGWISETALYYAIRNAFPQTQVIQHGRPDWLGRQHFDIWIPRWKIALEYQGTQHFEPVDFFGGIDGLHAAQERDHRKRMLSKQHQVHLIEVIEDDDHENIINRIKEIRYCGEMH